MIPTKMMFFYVPYLMLLWISCSRAVDECIDENCAISQPEILDSMYSYRGQYYINEFRKLESTGGQYSPISDETFTSQHYLGMEAVENAWNELNMSSISDGAVILDAGGGLGGVSRYLASRHLGATFVSVDFNEEFTSLARKLTSRANLSGRIIHYTGDLVKLKEIWNGPQFDGVMSFLCFLHIADKQALFDSISGSMKIGGKLYFEDLISPGDVLSEQDLKSLTEDVSTAMPMLSTEQYSLILTNSGFEIESLIDMTESWSAYTDERLQLYQANFGRYVDLHGEAISNSFLSFYNVMADLFHRKVIKGIRLTCRKVR